jgi:hypothetical protein
VIKDLAKYTSACDCGGSGSCLIVVKTDKGLILVIMILKGIDFLENIPRIFILTNTLCAGGMLRKDVIMLMVIAEQNFLGDLGFLTHFQEIRRHGALI